MTEIPQTCFQCGRPTELVLREDTKRDGWFTCECGEKIVQVSKVLPSGEPDEERIKRNLGFYEFRPTRRGT